MITEIDGDLLDFPNGVDVLFHQANCQNVMGAGIAAQIKQRYPAAFKADADCGPKGSCRLGKFSVAKVNDDPRRFIFNLYGQKTIGGDRSTNYEAIYEAMDRAFHLLETNILEHGGTFHVGIPHKMSCALAGGDWRILRAMIEVLVDKYKIPVTIVKYNKIAKHENQRNSLQAQH